MNLLKSNVLWAGVLIVLLGLLYVQSLHGHIARQAVTIDKNAKEIDRLQNSIDMLEKDLTISKNKEKLYVEQKKETETVKKEVADKVTVVKKKVESMTQVEKDSGDEILAAWVFYESLQNAPQ